MEMLEIYKIGRKSYVVFKPSLSEEEVVTKANRYFKVKRSMLVAKKCVVQRNILHITGGKGTKVWAVWIDRTR